MEKSLYDSPESNLIDKSPTKLSAAEKLAQSRRDIEESEAIQKLNMIWGVRLVTNVLLCALGAYMVIFSLDNPTSENFAAGAIIFIFFAIEIIPIIGYFRRKKWCVIPLHIFSALALFNFPIGTILSIMHFMNMGKIQFKK